MKLASFVALWSSEVVLCVARAELAEVLRSLGNNICKQLELDSA